MVKTIAIDGVYTLEKKVGQGGMATVFQAKVDPDRFDYSTLYAYTLVQGQSHTRRRQKAEQLAAKLSQRDLDRGTMRAILEESGIPLPGRRVALKIATTSHVDRKRFAGEWKNLLCLAHPNVIEVYGGGIYKGRPYYSMELLDGVVGVKTLREQFDLRRKIEVVLDGAAGLAYLHDSGIVHRDVKPGNLLTFSDGEGGYVTKVTDLGIAKNLDEDYAATMPQAVMGTPYYMSPEQLRSSCEVDRRADIYSLGATLYYLVTDHKPFEEKTSIYEIITAVGDGRRPLAPRQHAPELPEAICSIISCAMACDPGHRYQDMEQLSSDLKLYLEHENADLLQSPGGSPLGGTQAVSSACGAGYQFERFRKKPAPDRPLISPGAAATLRRRRGRRKPAGRKRTKKPLLIASAAAAAAAAIIVLITAVLPTLRGPDAAEELLAQAEAAEHAGRYEQALTLLAEALSESDGDAQIKALKAELAGRIHQREVLSRYESYKALGEEQTSHGRLEESLVYYERALEVAQDLESEPESAEAVRLRMGEAAAALRHAREQAELLDEYEKFLHAARAAQSEGLREEAKAAYGRAAAAGARLDEEPESFAGIYDEIERCRETEAHEEEIVVETGPPWDAVKGEEDEVAVAGDGGIVFVRPDGKWRYLIPCGDAIASAGSDRRHMLWRYPPVAGQLGEESPEAISALKAADILKQVRREKMERYSEAVSAAGRAARDLARRVEGLEQREAEEDETNGCRTAVTERGAVIVLEEGGAWSAGPPMDEVEINRALNMRDHELWSHPEVVTMLAGRTPESLSFAGARSILRGAMLAGLQRHAAAFDSIADAAGAPAHDPDAVPVDSDTATASETEEVDETDAELRRAPSGRTYRNRLGMEFVWIPPGRYARGYRLPVHELIARYGGDAELYERAYPRHGVTISRGFFMARTPVTQAQYERIMGVNPSYFRGDGDLPVEQVSWHQAVAFAERLSELDGKSYRLPTEAEWEHAARAGTDTEFFFGDDIKDLDRYAWHEGNSGGRTHPVGRRKPNPAGLYDIYGNVWEWCMDRYGGYPSGHVTDPVGPETGSQRVMRGGSWMRPGVRCLSASRGRMRPDNHENHYGFRLVIDER